MDELIIQIIAALEKHLSKKQIKKDIKDLEKTPFYIKLIGRLNKSLTRGQIQADIRNIQNTANNNPIELNAEINSDSLQRSFDEARADLERNIQNNPVEIDVNANVDTDEIVQAQQQIGQHTNRILGDYITANQIFRAVIQSIKVAVQEIENLNKAETDLQMITQNSAEEIKSLMQDYNNLAVEMGATTLQVTDGASEWLRQGKSISDTNELIRDSMILSKISQMESSEATKHLTSAMNGFKLETSEVIGVVDKLNAVDLASASDAAGLAESLSRCANSADIAGISVDRLIAYIATVSEVTQKSASSVGEGFKSITARLQNIKVNKFIDEDGTSILNEISDAEKILNKFNIALRKNAKEFRNAEDVIDDVAKSWHNMSSVEQSAIASAFGTVHQRENVIALFENYNRVLELTEVSANSAGTAMEKFAVYENSLEASTNRLVASLQGIAYNTIDSNFLTNLTKELEKQIEEYADKLQDVFKDEIDYEIKYIEITRDKYNDFIDSRIDRYENEKKAVEDKYDAEIKSIDDTIDALKDKNDETKTAIDLKKAEQDLENAKQRTRMVYGADGTVSYRQDTDKVEEAQQKVDDLKLDMLLDSLEKQKEAKEAEKDAALQTYEAMIEDLEQQKKDRDEFFETVVEKLDNINNPQPTEGIDSVINNTYDNPSEANEVKQGLKDVENAVKDGTEQVKDNANEVKKADNNTSNSANKTDNKSQSANSKTATTANSNNNAVKTDVKQSGNSVNTNTSETADNKTDASNKQVVVYGEQVAVYDNGGENKQTEQTSNMDSFMKLLYSMSGKEPDGYERWKRGEYDEGFKRMGNIFSDDAFMNRATKPYEDAINSFNETINKINAVNAANKQPVSISTGDIVIQNPVGDAKQLAKEVKNEIYKEAMMELPNAFQKQMYTNLK